MKASQIPTIALVWLCCAKISSADPLRVMAIGDSMTEEYSFEFPFSAPDSAPLIANTMNWVEILSARRPDDISFGNYEEDLLSYDDYRNAGYQYNWGIPGFTSGQWKEIATASFLDPVALYNRVQMAPQYSQVDVVVIMIGGNDLRAQYGDLYDPQPGDPTTQEIIDAIISNMSKVIDEARLGSSTVPIVLADVPDLGAAPDKIAAHPDPVKRAAASAKIALLNQAVADLANLRGATLARISKLTDMVTAAEPVFIGAIEMIKDIDPIRENRPRYLFCKEGLHPSTNGQAVIANELLSAINSATSSNISLLSNREIITHLLGLNPDQPFISWLLTHGITDTNMQTDTDGDGIPNLGEYLLGFSPVAANSSFKPVLTTSQTPQQLHWDYHIDAQANRLATAQAKQSTDLISWNPLDNGSLLDLENGNYRATIDTSAGRVFLRFEFTLKP